MPLVDPVTMSSSLTKTVKPTQASEVKDGKDSSPVVVRLRPVELQQTPASQAARRAIPVLIAAVYLVRFSALVADPVAWMKTTLPQIAILQVAYVLLCLPTPGAAQKPAANRKLRPGEKKKPEAGGSNPYVTAILSLLLSIFVTPFFYIAMVLFGAPFLSHVSHTMLCAAHLSILTLTPLFYVHGVDSSAWVAVAGFQAPLDETFGGLVGGVVGAWLGAVPIPLDWDREWQQWPVTILCGIYGGYLLGKVVGGTLLHGKRF
ncbi:glycosylphophatidylinositol anchor phosphoethanolamine transferase [Diplogelasinospora grovesii]|uniref:Glycosylphophatidylinositol anchor phosphoethanolamine transferase n=1 Tax=Diplogelasinospora grovesii TaxID=303347 RepID=A0AAN6SA29_9PEZI|nr:glycosylphophatidylinositol anchor phosphoethanolamine transferase [Diplogelasinospora grovesii]